MDSLENMMKLNIWHYFILIYSHKFMKIKINPDHGLPLEKTLNMHNVVMLVKSIFNKNHNHLSFLIFFK